MPTTARMRTTSLILWTGALVTLGIGARLRTLGAWRPELPERLGSWQGTRSTPGFSARDRTSDAPIQSSVFRSPLGESVSVHIFASSALSGLDDPLVSSGRFEVVAERDVVLPGLGRVHAVSYRDPREAKIRMLGYSWWQVRSGGVEALALGGSNKTSRRFQAGLVILRSGDGCWVRLVGGIDPEDSAGMRSRRTFDRLASQLIRALAAKGKSSQE